MGLALKAKRLSGPFLFLEQFLTGGFMAKRGKHTKIVSGKHEGHMKKGKRKHGGRKRKGHKK